jgi:excisionase family DNA binding protein
MGKDEYRIAVTECGLALKQFIGHAERLLLCFLERQSAQTTVTAAQVSPQIAPIQPSPLLDVKTVSRLLTCSSRHVYRLSDMGAMPRPIKLGNLIRWRRQDLDDWIADGCKHCRR